MWSSELSGEERKRLDLGIALAGNPKLLLLDEPTVGLDSKGRKEFWRTFRRCVVEGAAILIVTQEPSDWQELETIATRSITLQEGQFLEAQILKDGTEIDQRNFDLEQESPSTPQSQQ